MISKNREMAKEKRMQSIVDSAENLFFSNNYDDVSINDIAKETKLSKGSIYTYFKNKDELFFAVVLRGIRILNKLIIDKMGKGRIGIEKYFAFRKAYHEFALDYYDYYRIYNYFLSERFDITEVVNVNYMKKVIQEGRQYSVFPASFAPVSDFLKEIIDLRMEMVTMLCEAIKTGLEDGSIRSDADPLEMAVLLLLLTQSIELVPYDFKRLLEAEGLSHEKFVIDVDEILSKFIMDKYK